MGTASAQSSQLPSTASRSPARRGWPHSTVGQVPGWRPGSCWASQAGASASRASAPTRADARAERTRAIARIVRGTTPLLDLLLDEEARRGIHAVLIGRARALVGGVHLVAVEIAERLGGELAVAVVGVAVAPAKVVVEVVRLLLLEIQRAPHLIAAPQAHRVLAGTRGLARH